MYLLNISIIIYICNKKYIGIHRLLIYVLHYNFVLQLLGKWYAIQKTSTSSRCLEYNFEKTDEPNSYKLDQMSENSIINVAKSNNYHYVGTLKADQDLPSRMIANFPLSK